MVGEHTIDTVLFIHVPTEWQTTNRRYAFLALAETLPSHVAVVCVNRAVDPVVTLLKRPRKFLSGVWRTRDERVSDRLRVVTPRLILHEIPAAKVPGATAINRILMRRQLRGAMSRWFPKAERVIQWIHHPVQHWIYRALPDAGKVYHCYDEYNCSPDGIFHERRWERERELIREADLTFVTSESLKHRREGVARRMGVIPNGIPDFFFAAQSPPPDPIDRIPRPRIGYLGNIFSLLDYPLLEKIFRRRPDWQLVFVGPIEAEAHVRSLRSLDNVHFMGTRPHESLPNLLPRLDVGLMPFLVNDFTRPLVPLKLFEYLAAGLPVVSTDLPNLQEFRSLIRLVPDEADTFERAIAETLRLDREQESAKLKMEARKHTWSQINREYVVPALCEVFGL